MPTYTLAALRAQVGFACDVTIGDARYTTAMVNTWVNTAVQNYQNLRSSYAGSDDSRVTIVGSSSVALSNGFPTNELVPLPSNFLKLRAVWVISPTGRRELEHLSESDRFDIALQTVGEPWAYRVTTLDDSTQALRVWPAMSSAYTFEVVYTRVPTTLSADGDLWTYEAGCEDLVICEVATKLLERDGVPEPATYQALQQRRVVAAEQLKSILCGQDPGVRTMRDTRGLSRAQARKDWLR